MPVKQAKKTDIGLWLLVSAALLTGLLIQLVLGMVREREDAAVSRRIAVELSASAEQRVEDLQARRAVEAQAAAPGLHSLAAQKRSARDEEPVALLLLVNPWNPVPEGYVPTLENIVDQYDVDARCAEALRRMMADCRAAGNAPYICSAYRTQAMQQMLFDNKVLRVIYEDGVAPENASAVAARTVAYPGTSEHQLGLAVDIIDENYPVLDEGQEDTSTQMWLMENSWRYGFILRYPNGTTDITGIIYEPWHYRYVGPYAEEIYQRDVTLEEFLQLRRGK